MIKRLFQRIFESYLYWLLSHLFPKSEICLCCDYTNDIYGNLKAIASEMERQEVNFIWIYSNQNNFISMIKNIYNLSRAKVIIFDTSNRLWAQLQLDKETNTIYCGHGGGVYKKMGWAALKLGDHNGYKKLKSRRFDWVISSAPHLEDYICQNYAVLPHKVLPYGLPRTDIFFIKEWEAVRKNFADKYPEIVGKKIITFAPTFRSTNGRRYIKHVEEMSFPSEYMVLYRAHPTITDQIALPKHWINVSDAHQDDVMAITDILITDYSSVLFDYSFLNRLIILYVPDENEYRKFERDLWVSPVDLVGEKNVCKNLDELYQALKNQTLENSVWERFMASCDGRSAERIVDFAVTLLNRNNK